MSENKLACTVHADERFSKNNALQTTNVSAILFIIKTSASNFQTVSQYTDTSAITQQRKCVSNFSSTLIKFSNNNNTQLVNLDSRVMTSQDLSKDRRRTTRNYCVFAFLCKNCNKKRTETSINMAQESSLKSHYFSVGISKVKKYAA